MSVNAKIHRDFFHHLSGIPKVATLFPEEKQLRCLKSFCAVHAMTLYDMETDNIWCNDEIIHDIEDYLSFLVKIQKDGFPEKGTNHYFDFKALEVNLKKKLKHFYTDKWNFWDLRKFWNIFLEITDEKYPSISVDCDDNVKSSSQLLSKFHTEFIVAVRYQCIRAWSLRIVDLFQSNDVIYLDDLANSFAPFLETWKSLYQPRFNTECCKDYLDALFMNGVDESVSPSFPTSLMENELSLLKEIENVAMLYHKTTSKHDDATLYQLNVYVSI